MNAERLHILAKSVGHEWRTKKIANVLQEMLNALKGTVEQPQNQAHQEKLSQQLDLLYTRLEEDPAGEFAPSAWAQMGDMGIDDLVGENLAASVRSVFESNQITPASALSEINELTVRFKNTEGALSRLVDSFDFLGVGADELAENECEFGVLIPRAAVNNLLGDLGTEFQVLAKIRDPFAELALGKRSQMTVTSISSSEFMVFLKDAAPVVLAIGIAIERLAAFYKQILEIRKLHEELRLQGVSEERLEGIQAHADEHMSEGIEEIVKDFVGKRYSVSNKGRENELRHELRAVLHRLAVRMDRGYNFEIRVDVAQEDEGQAVDSQDRILRTEIRRISNSLKFLHLDGEGILSLPDVKATEDGVESM